MTLHFKQIGKGPPVVVLHGLFGSLNNWITVGKMLSEGRSVYLVDQRNHGRSFHSADHSYRLMSADLLSFLDQQTLDMVDIVGHSMGGKTGMTLALAHPNRVRKLVVVDIAPRSYPPSHDRIIDALVGLRLEALSSREEAMDALATAIPEDRVRHFLLTNLRRNPQGGFSWKMNLEALNRNYKEISKGIHTETKGAMPVLFVRGERSGYIDRDDLVQIRRLFPSARLVTIPGAGHWVHADAREEFVRILEEFLGSTR